MKIGNLIIDHLDCCLVDSERRPFVSLKPLTDDLNNVEAFQKVVEDIEQKNGRGFDIVKRHHTMEFGSKIYPWLYNEVVIELSH